MLFFNSDTAYTGVYCNRYFGKCNISKDGKITMRHPTASRRYCQGGYSEWEGQLFGWYRSVTTYTLKSNLLILYTGKDEKLVFKKE
jgi:heat shock protein HslJ